MVSKKHISGIILNDVYPRLSKTTSQLTHFFILFYFIEPFCFRVSNTNNIDHQTDNQENLEVKLSLKKQIWIRTTCINKEVEMDEFEQQLSTRIPYVINKKLKNARENLDLLK